MAPGRHLAAHPRHALRRHPCRRWQTPSAQCRDHGSPVGQHHRKRGGHGDDTPKHVNGRKRPLLVETRGVLLAVTVTAASVQDRAGAMQLLDGVRHTFSRLRLIWADQAYGGDLIAWVWALRPR